MGPINGTTSNISAYASEIFNSPATQSAVKSTEQATNRSSADAPLPKGVEESISAFEKYLNGNSDKIKSSDWPESLQGDILAMMMNGAYKTA
jgi:hypothetical protein